MGFKGLATIFCLFLLAGCGIEHVESLAAWNFELAGQAPSTVILPVHLDSVLPSTSTTFVLRRTVVLPNDFRGKRLTLGFARLSGIAELTVNEHPAISLETDRLPISQPYRAPGTQRWAIGAEETTGETLDLALLVHHRWSQSAWLDCVPRLSATSQGDVALLTIRTLNESLSFFAMAMGTLVGFSYALVFLSDRRRVVYGWFALEAVGGIAYPSFASGLSQHFFGTSDTTVLALQVTLGALSAVHFARAYYGLGPTSRLFCYGWLVFIVVAIGVNGPFTSTRYSTPLIVLMIGGATLYQLGLGVHLHWRNPRPKNILVVTFAWPLAALLAGSDCLSWLGFGEPLGGIQTGGAAIAFVSLLRAAALSSDHQQSLRVTDQLNAELEARVALLEQKRREVEGLNAELRRQITARSEQFADALAKLASHHEGAINLAVGDVLAGQYRVLRPIATGGMGAVFEVERTGDLERFALKVLTGNHDPSAVARFAREAQIASQIHHPNVVAIRDIGVASPECFLFLVMEYVQGAPLSELKDRCGKVRWALPVLGQVAQGLAAIHERGIVHRDLKPANVLVVEEPGGVARAKIVDFGIAMLTEPPVGPVGPVGEEVDTVAFAKPGPALRMDDGANHLPLTRTGVVMGTPLYMAPELTEGAKNARPSADIFSFGVVAYEVLTGLVPYAERRSRRNVYDPRWHPKPLATLCPDLAIEAALTLDACLSLDPASRPSAMAVAHTLLRAIPRKGAR